MSKYENTLKDKFLIKILKVSEEDLAKTNKRAIIVSSYLSIRNDKKVLWNHISKTIKYIKSLDEIQFDKLLIVVKETVTMVNKDSIKAVDFIIATFKNMREKELQYIGKYVTMFKRHLGDVNKIHVLNDIFIKFWWSLYIGNDKMKFITNEQTYNGKKLMLIFKNFTLGVDNNYLINNFPLIVGVMCGLVIDKINKNDFDNIKLYLDFILSTYDIKDKYFEILEEDENYFIESKEWII